jgi:hypothetical protein
MPEAAALAALRRDIDRRPQRIKALLCDANIRKEFLGGVSKDEAKVGKRFVDEHAESNLKTKPKVSVSSLSFLFARWPPTLTSPLSKWVRPAPPRICYLGCECCEIMLGTRNPVFSKYGRRMRNPAGLDSTSEYQEID